VGDIEAILRHHHRKRSRGPSPQMTFWPGSAAIDCPEVEALDEEGECQAIALRVASEQGFEVVVGWAVAAEHEPLLHFWNRREDGAIIDAARARRAATGYLGGAMTAAEVHEMREAIYREGSLRDNFRSLGRAFGALLDGPV
jgi:hypothetical protein